MPCGGIYKGSPLPGGATGDATGECWMCGKPGGDYFCDEWDAFLHRNCIPAFLMTEEGKLTWETHGHAVFLEESDGE